MIGHTKVWVVIVLLHGCTALANMLIWVWTFVAIAALACYVMQTMAFTDSLVMVC